MNPIAEHLELRPNNFTKLLFLALVFLCLFGFLISQEGNGKWICAFGVLFFGGGFWMSLEYRLVTFQDGFTEYNLFNTRHVLWQQIISIKYETVYHWHGVSLQLTILYEAPSKHILLHVKQYKENKMQLFFEMLNEQCPYAEKNDHFIKKATGVMGWKDKLKMY